MFRPLILALILAAPLSGQVSRYELGRRVIRAELAYESADAKARHACAKPFDDAVRAFLRLNLTRAAERLDDAYHTLEGAPEPSAGREILDHYFLTSPRLIDAKTEILAVTIRPTRKLPKKKLPPGLTVSASIGDRKPVAAELAESVELKLPLSGLKPGTHTVRVALALDGKYAVTWEYPVALAENLEARLAALKKAAAIKAKTVEQLTLADHLDKLGELAASEPSETDFPALDLLAEAEILAKALGDAKRFDAPDRTGQFWLTLPEPNVKLRLQLPKADGKLPLLIALHGAGGSENLFFEGYGGGCVAKECAERNWAMVAPRLGFGGGPNLPQLIDALAERYPAIDPKRVYVVGHSMGAAAAISALERSPERFLGVAALGGGGYVPKNAKIAAVPVFVGVGKEDFALGMARKLVKDLTAAGVSKLAAKEYDDIEHLLIVRAAVADLFAFFESSKKAP